MPNWCENKMSVSGPKDDISRFVSDTKCEEAAISFQNIVPVPADILAKPYGPYGYWAQVVLWGTKWEPWRVELSTINEEEVFYRFGTAWDPPLPFVIRASAKYPDLEFLISYEEPDNIVFGQMLASEGKVTQVDELYDLTDEDVEKETEKALNQGSLCFSCISHMDEAFSEEASRRKFLEKLDPHLMLAV